MTLGQRISRLRRDREWTQALFARKVGIHARHVSRWEQDKNRPSMRMLEKIAEVYEISLDELMQGNDAAVHPETMIQDAELLRSFQELGELDDEDRSTICRVIQAFVTKKRMEKVLKSA